MSKLSAALAGAALISLPMAGSVPAAEDWGPVQRDERVREVPYDQQLFSSDPEYSITYDPQAEIDIYGGKSAISTPRPPVEIFRDLYDEGPLGEGFTLFGDKNRIFPQILVFGDLRTAVAFNDNGQQEIAQIAARANINIDFKLTATERIHLFFQPLQNGAEFTRYEFAGGDADRTGVEIETTEQPTNAFIEGDLGAIFAGLTDEYNKYDIPFAAGRVPLFLQNGVWFDDQFLGFAVTPLVAQNSPTLDITNYDVTFFAGFDEIDSPAIVDGATGQQADHDANIYGVHGFFDTREGYLEVGYAYLDDRDGSNGDFSYHNFTVAFSKRYAATVSNATRVIVNIGQDPGRGFNETAEGVLFLSENSWITHLPLTLIPYSNFWFGVDSTQSASRNGAAGGVLKNVGINFETDGLTGFPTLDATGIDTFGGALGVQYLFGLDQQIVGEFAAVFPYDDREGPAQDPQFGFGVRYQKPLTNRVIVRADAMYGLLLDTQNIFGIRAELRLKL